jgi:hypothetical protein
MGEDLLIRIQRYKVVHKVTLREKPLGDGVHGSVFVREGKLATAIKFFQRKGDFERELEVYRHLTKRSVCVIRDLSVPQLLSWDSECFAIEMTIVERPYLLDFAHAEFQKPDFPEDVWQEWEEERKELFGSDWRKVKRVLAALEGLGIYYLDPHPMNIAFEDEA